ncbi:hypothetical protein BURPS1655_K0009 [Burkholderia pseudomallei 1655]|nr:hypothetical protein BURPS1655_K0009 [Burkholderia pseudomallei 1655]
MRAGGAPSCALRGRVPLRAAARRRRGPAGCLIARSKDHFFRAPARAYPRRRVRACCAFAARFVGGYRRASRSSAVASVSSRFAKQKRTTPDSCGS